MRCWPVGRRGFFAFFWSAWLSACWYHEHLCHCAAVFGSATAPLSLLAAGRHLFLSPIQPIALTGSTFDPVTDHRLPCEGVAPSPPTPSMRTSPGPREDGPLVETVGSTCSYSPVPSMRTAPRTPREDGSLAETVGSTCSSSPAPEMRITPGLRVDGRFSAAVGSFPPAPGMLAAPGPREDGRMIVAVASTPQAPGTQSTPGPRVNDTSLHFPRASSPTSSFEAPTMSRRV